MKYKLLCKRLNSCSKWLKARAKRFTIPAKLVLVTDDWTLRTRLNDSPDNVVSELFDASLANKSIKHIIYLPHEIMLFVGNVSGAKRQTNIDPQVIETILSWFS